MKGLKIIFTALGGITLIFLGLGWVVPSYEYQSSVVVNASPEKCWEVFHNINKMDQWLEGFESLTLKSGEPMIPGSLYEIVISDNDHRMVMREKLIAVSAPTKISYELNNDVLKSEFYYSFKGSNSTTITSHYKITGNNILWKSILLLSKSYMINSGQGQLEALKKVIEKE